MREVMKATGLPRSTILHYVAEGLLPEPTRSARNVATYGADSVDRLRLIRALQKNKRYTLAEIRRYLASAHDAEQIRALASLSDTVFGQQEGRRFNHAEVAAASGLSDATLRAVVRAGLIVPRDDDSFDDEDVGMAVEFGRSLSMGLKIADFAFYARCARELVDGEIGLRERLIGGLDLTANATLTEEMTRSARTYRTYIFERTFQRKVTHMSMDEQGGK
jgi:DNA-binding transcriptional MerR regulator